MLIAGRTLQGVGASGIYLIFDFVCCNQASLRQRGKYVGLIFFWSALAAAMEPLFVDGREAMKWRWVLFLNAVTCGLVLGQILSFIRVKLWAADSHQSTKWDILGVESLSNLVVIPSIITAEVGMVIKLIGSC